METRASQPMAAEAAAPPPPPGAAGAGEGGAAGAATRDEPVAQFEGASEAVELGFFESDEDDSDEEQEGQEEPLLKMHEDGNWLRWYDGLAGGAQPTLLFPPRSADEINAAVACEGCKQPMSFFLQIYAPLDGERFEHAFHRSLMVFICRGDGACGGSAVVLRGQLARTNPFYAHTCASEDEEVACLFDRTEVPALALGPEFPMKRIVTEPEPAAGSDRCGLCERPAASRCAACKVVAYCCKEHQKEHWSSHKELCKLLQAELAKPDDDAGGDGGDGAVEEGASASATGAEAAVGEKRDEDFTQEDFDEMVSGGSEAIKAKIAKDPVFERFQDRIARDPSQCVRYCRWPAQGVQGGDDADEELDNGPLWVSSEKQCEAPPACERCGQPRAFELQVLPQSLHYLNELELDFGTICAFTCTASCRLEEGEFAREFAFVQRL